jgi:hypothetical protein
MTLAMSRIGRSITTISNGLSGGSITLLSTSGDQDENLTVDYTTQSNERKSWVRFLGSSFSANYKTGQYNLTKAVTLLLQHETSTRDDRKKRAEEDKLRKLMRARSNEAEEYNKDLKSYGNVSVAHPVWSNPKKEFYLTLSATDLNELRFMVDYLTDGGFIKLQAEPKLHMKKKEE